jgi:hypothetical protein
VDEPDLALRLAEGLRERPEAAITTQTDEGNIYSSAHTFEELNLSPDLLKVWEIEGWRECVVAVQQQHVAVGARRPGWFSGVADGCMVRVVCSPVALLLLPCPHACTAPAHCAPLLSAPYSKCSFSQRITTFSSLPHPTPRRVCTWR